MIVTIRYFLKSIKSVFMIVQCNTSLSKNCCTVNNCSLCDRLNLKKNSLKVCLHSLCILNQSYDDDFSTNSHSTTVLETVENGSSNVVKFELCDISILQV